MTSRAPGASELSTFERSYRTALRTHVTGGPSAGRRLGLRAAVLKLGTLALARLHDRAAASMSSPEPSTASHRKRATTLAEAFFSEAAATLQSEQPSARAARGKAEQVAAQLERRTTQLAAVRARLVRETALKLDARADVRSQRKQNDDVLARSQLLQANLRQISHRVLNAQEQERMRISRDLHDAIGQALTGINVGLAALKLESATKSQELATAIERAQRLVADSMRTVHRFAWELRPTLLDDLGLVPALRSYTKAFAARTGIKLRFSADPGDLDLDADATTALFRVAQGALTNIERHADAKRARLLLHARRGVMTLEVGDDGKSFDVAKLERKRDPRHLGLLVMRERVEMVGGSFSVKSSPGHGTTIRCEVPLVAKTDKLST